MQKGLDAELALLPFRPVTMKVLQCAFISGIKYGSFFSLFSFSYPLFLCTYRLSYFICFYMFGLPL